MNKVRKAVEGLRRGIPFFAKEVCEPSCSSILEG